MTDLDFNRHPVEKVCMQKLNQVGIVPQTDKPYSLQLLVWTLECHPSAVPAVAKSSIKQLFELAIQMFNWDAKTIQLHLLEPIPWPKETMSQIDEWSPEQLGAALIERLYRNLQENGQS